MSSDCTAKVLPTPLWAVMVVTFLGSLGTGIFWNGLAFVAKHGYEFSEARNLLLYAVNGTIYAFGAFYAGRAIKWIRRVLSTRATLALILLTQAVLCAGPIFIAGQWVIWVVSASVSVLAAATWATVESYLTAGRHGLAMRRAIGWFNLFWTGAVAASMFLMAPLTEHYAWWAIGGMAFIYLACLTPLPWFGHDPTTHDLSLAAASVTPTYRWLLQSARVLLPLSYVLNSAMTPILPYRFEALELAVHYETPATGTWMVVRVLVLAIMWRANFWHGRWGTLLFGAAAMTLGFALVIGGPTLHWMFAGFALFGTGLGVIYYTALYYAMAVGHAEIDAGGTHEGLIGVGYALGPFAGLAGLGLSRWPVTAAISASSGAWTITAVWSIVALACWPAVRPYVRCKRMERAPEAEPLHPDDSPM